MKKLEIEYMNVDDIIPYENNPRRNEDAVEYVANSIKEFGFKVPIIIDKENIIVTGHTRLLSAKKLGLKEVPVIRAEDLSEEQINAFRLADNKVSEFASWDFDKLDSELENINLDMEEFGFTKLEDIDLDQFIEDLPDKQKDDKKEMIKCPCCGEIFEMKEEYIK